MIKIINARLKSTIDAPACKPIPELIINYFIRYGYPLTNFNYFSYGTDAKNITRIRLFSNRVCRGAKPLCRGPARRTRLWQAGPGGFPQPRKSPKTGGF